MFYFRICLSVLGFVLLYLFRDRFEYCATGCRKKARMIGIHAKQKIKKYHEGDYEVQDEKEGTGRNILHTGYRLL